MLPTDESAGTIATCTAGVAEFRATLSWGRVEDVPATPTVFALPETVRCSLVQTDEAMRREILGEIRAFTPRDLGSALELVLRSLTVAAALSDALLETRATRLAHPGSAPAGTLQALALDLWEAGFRVRFARSWTPVPDGALALGVRGAEAKLRRSLKGHPSWRLV